jgi:ribose 5-phosphate isomerase A
MDNSEAKLAVAKAAIEYVPEGAIIGVGTGTTANCFIDGNPRSGVK